MFESVFINFVVNNFFLPSAIGIISSSCMGHRKNAINMKITWWIFTIRQIQAKFFEIIPRFLNFRPSVSQFERYDKTSNLFITTRDKNFSFIRFRVIISYIKILVVISLNEKNYTNRLNRLRESLIDLSLISRIYANIRRTNDRKSGETIERERGEWRVVTRAAREGSVIFDLELEKKWKKHWRNWSFLHNMDDT